MKKNWMLVGMSILSLALFTGCTSSADTMPSPSPSASATGLPTNSPMPANTEGPTVSIAPAVTPDATDAMSGGVNTVEDAERASERVAEEVEKLSELDDAVAVVAGNIALIGVEYDAQYQGGMTDRLQQMVEERVAMIDKSVTTVHVTDDAEAVRSIRQLQERLDEGQMTFEELQTEVLEIGSGIAGGSNPQITQPETNTGV